MLSSTQRRIGLIVVAFLVFLIPTLIALGVFAPLGRQTHGSMSVASESEADAFKTDLVYSTLSTSDNSENAEIYVRADDGAAVRITDYAGPDFAPSLSHDGTKIAFVSDRDDPGNMDIYVMNADGTNVMRVTRDPEIDARPSWAPSGAEVAFARAEGYHFDIWVAAVDGTGERRLTNNDVDDFAPAWSPDGEVIAFQRYVDTDLELFVIAPDGTKEARLTSSPGEDRDPVWAPDGRTIAFVQDSGETGQTVVSLLPVGGAQKATNQASLLTSMSAGLMSDPVWSADGLGIAFVSHDSSGYSIQGRLVDDEATLLAPGVPDALAQQLNDGYRLLGIDGTA